MDILTFYYLKNQPNRKYDSFVEAMNDSDKQFDLLGIIQFLKFNYPLYDRTFVKNIKFSYSWKNREELNFRYNEKREGYSVKNEKSLWLILKNSLINICKDKQKIYGIGNSGGLDSRIILYFLKKLCVSILITKMHGKD